MLNHAMLLASTKKELNLIARVRFIVNDETGNDGSYSKGFLYGDDIEVLEGTLDVRLLCDSDNADESLTDTSDFQFAYDASLESIQKIVALNEVTNKKTSFTSFMEYDGIEIFKGPYGFFDDVAVGQSCIVAFYV